MNYISRSEVFKALEEIKSDVIVSGNFAFVGENMYVKQALQKGQIPIEWIEEQARQKGGTLYESVLHNLLNEWEKVRKEE